VFHNCFLLHKDCSQDLSSIISTPQLLLFIIFFEFRYQIRVISLNSYSINFLILVVESQFITILLFAPTKFSGVLHLNDLCINLCSNLQPL